MSLRVQAVVMQAQQPFVYEVVPKSRRCHRSKVAKAIKDKHTFLRKPGRITRTRLPTRSALPMAKQRWLSNGWH
ncbi:hypothetical protein SynROS8604_00130 [Synechococcus sp. ROS8604]|nr:hypothetical protein SynROS8604_00130 [Synechococcus sp. ROS8604]